jgi:hypothetical protein
MYQEVSRCWHAQNPALGPSSKFHLVPTSWLQQWVTGESASAAAVAAATGDKAAPISVDLTASVSVSASSATQDLSESDGYDAVNKVQSSDDIAMGDIVHSGEGVSAGGTVDVDDAAVRPDTTSDVVTIVKDVDDNITSSSSTAATVTAIPATGPQQQGGASSSLPTAVSVFKEPIFNRPYLCQHYREHGSGADPRCSSHMKMVSKEAFTLILKNLLSSSSTSSANSSSNRGNNTSSSYNTTSFTSIAPRDNSGDNAVTNRTRAVSLQLPDHHKADGTNADWKASLVDCDLSERNYICSLCQNDARKSRSQLQVYSLYEIDSIILYLLYHIHLKHSTALNIQYYLSRLAFPIYYITQCIV